MTILVFGLVVFLGLHSISIFAPGARDRWAQAMGVMAWRGLHSVGSLASLVLMIYGYVLARQAPVLVYVPPASLRQVTLLLMLAFFPLVLAVFLPGRISAAVKHPMLTATKTWALAHLLANGNLADVLLFGGFLAWAVADRISLKRRPASPQKVSASPLRNDLIAVVGGLALYIVMLMWAHRVLIGMPLV